MTARTASCWVVSTIRIDDAGLSTIMIIPEAIVKFEGRKVTTWHAPGHSMQQLDAIVDACWRLPPGPPTEEVLSERHLEPLLSHQFFSQ